MTTIHQVSRKPSRTGSLYWRQTMAAWLLLLPVILFFALLIYYPTIQAFIMSFSNWDLFRDSASFVGVDNYLRLLSDRNFLRSLQNTLVYTFFTVAIGAILALIFATLLSRDLKGNGIFKFIYYIPVITPLVASAVIWRWFYHPTGLLNYLLSFLGFQRIGWLVDPAYAMPALIIMSIWGHLGFHMLIFLAGLKGIAPVYYDAAKVDGANDWQRFFYITLPQLRPVILFVVVTYTISAFKVFGQVYVMTSGGPMDSTRVLVLTIYETAFRSAKLGYASAMSYVLFGILLLFTMVQLRLGRND
jgi:ABC-type sugar transport system permease subunit